MDGGFGGLGEFGAPPRPPHRASFSANTLASLLVILLMRGSSAFSKNRAPSPRLQFIQNALLSGIVTVRYERGEGATRHQRDMIEFLHVRYPPPLHPLQNPCRSPYHRHHHRRGKTGSVRKHHQRRRINLSMGRKVRAIG